MRVEYRYEAKLVLGKEEAHLSRGLVGSQPFELLDIGFGTVRSEVHFGDVGQSPSGEGEEGSEIYAHWRGVLDAFPFFEDVLKSNEHLGRGGGS